MTLWVIRILFLSLCTVAGYAITQMQPDLISSPIAGPFIGFGLGGLLIGIDEMVKGLSLRAFSAMTFGLLLGTLIASMIDRSQIFAFADTSTLWVIRLGLFLSFSYIGMILAMRSNKEDFYLIIPFIRFAPQHKPENLLLLDTSAIIDGRVAELLEASYLEGIVVTPRFVLHELQHIADSNDAIRRARGRRGLDTLSRLQKSEKLEIKIHEGDFKDETEVDAKLVRLAKLLGAKLVTTDYNLGKIAELQRVPLLNVHQLAAAIKNVVVPGETLSLRLAREGKDKGQAVGYLNDGTMVVVNQAQSLIGQQAQVQIVSSLQTGAGVIVFADLVNTSTVEATSGGK
ncbi:MAG: twitching motility protein PilT [Verrucomicrobia bacterium]|nr:twitching motility protein PilT [Verrucomicrobiota bacterium]